MGNFCCPRASSGGYRRRSHWPRDPLELFESACKKQQHCSALPCMIEAVPPPTAGGGYNFDSSTAYWPHLSCKARLGCLPSTCSRRGWLMCQPARPDHWSVRRLGQCQLTTRKVTRRDCGLRDGQHAAVMSMIWLSLDGSAQPVVAMLGRQHDPKRPVSEVLSSTTRSTQPLPHRLEPCTDSELGIMRCSVRSRRQA